MKTLRNVVTIWSISGSMLLTGYVSAQNTGVNTISPTNTLDVNGNLRIRSIEKVNSADAMDILLANGSGVFSKISASDFVKALKIPSNVFNAQQTTSKAFPADSIKLNRIMFNDIKINDTETGTWDATNGTYTVIKPGIYLVISGVSFITPSNGNFTYYVNVGSSTQSFNTNSNSKEDNTAPEYVLSGTYLKVLAPGDVIYCNIKTQRSILYVQKSGFLHIIYTPL